jgi:hypothetical protein
MPNDNQRLRRTTSVTLIEPAPRWILSSQTWDALDHSFLNFDIDVASRNPYFGVRLVFPFGS